MGCFQDVLGKYKYLFLFEYMQKKEMSYYLLVFLSSKKEVDMDETLSHSTE